MSSKATHTMPSMTQVNAEAKQEVTSSVMTSLDKELLQSDPCRVYSHDQKLS